MYKKTICAFALAPQFLFAMDTAKVVKNQSTTNLHDASFWEQLQQDGSSFLSLLPKKTCTVIKNLIDAAKMLEEQKFESMYDYAGPKLRVSRKYIGRSLESVCPKSHMPYWRDWIPKTLQQQYKNHEHYDLFYAIATGNSPKVQEILKSGTTDISHAKIWNCPFVPCTPPARSSFTFYGPLQFAVINGFPEIVSLLCKAGALSNMNFSEHPLVEAEKRGFSETQQILLEHGADPQAIHSTKKHELTQ